jgi:DNA ligase-1
MFKPMKPPAGVLEDSDFNKLRFPLFGSTKIDGLRATVQDGKLLTSTLKPFLNKYVSKMLSNHILDGLDGELTVGSLTDGLCFNRSTSYLMAENPARQSDVWFNVFDKFDATKPYHERLVAASMQVYYYNEQLSTDDTNTPWFPKVRFVTQHVINNLEDFKFFDAHCVAEGYEGSMYRLRTSLYKQGRATLSNLELVRRKPFEDGEAVILSFKEEMLNTNATHVDELGHTKHSSHKAGKVGKGIMGGFIVRGLTALEGIEFSIGAHGTEKERKQMWEERDSIPGRIIKFKYQKYGMKTKARLPIALGFRDERDM